MILIAICDFERSDPVRRMVSLVGACSPTDGILQRSALQNDKRLPVILSEVKDPVRRTSRLPEHARPSSVEQAGCRECVLLRPGFSRDLSVIVTAFCPLVGIVARRRPMGFLQLSHASRRAAAGRYFLRLSMCARHFVPSAHASLREIPPCGAARTLYAVTPSDAPLAGRQFLRLAMSA